jgi:hypothetical protein
LSCCCQNFFVTRWSSRCTVPHVVSSTYVPSIINMYIHVDWYNLLCELFRSASKVACRTALRSSFCTNFRHQLLGMFCVGNSVKRTCNAHSPLGNTLLALHRIHVLASWSCRLSFEAQQDSK